MRQGISWVLGFVMIVASVGNSDYGLSKLVSAKLPIAEQTNKSNTIQPFMIVGEGIDNIIHIEPIPGGKLLAQTPLSYRLVDPQTGKMERLPQGFPEGEITQWEEDYAVVRTIANQTKPVTYLYTIWPTMVRCLTQKKYICFTDKHGAYASIDSSDNIDKFTVVSCVNSDGMLLWDKTIDKKPAYYGELGFVRVFDGKLVVGITTEYSLTIFNLENGDEIAEGNASFTATKDWSDSLFYAKPKKAGSFYTFENRLIVPKTATPTHSDQKQYATKEGFETASCKDDQLIYSYCVGNDGHALYNCRITNNSLPGIGSIMYVQNGVILISVGYSESFFLDAYTGKILGTVDTQNSTNISSFGLGNTICLVANGNFHFFDTVAKKMRNRFSLPMLVRAYGENTIGYTSSENGGKKGFEVFDTRNPEKKAFVGVPFFGASSSKRGIITWHDRVKKGEILGHLHKYEGGMEPLAFADTVIDTYWIGEYKGEIYGLFGYWWWDLWKTMIAVAKLENGKWVRIIKVADQISVPYTNWASDGRILTIDQGALSIVQLDEMKQYLYTIPEGFTDTYGRYSYNIELLKDCVVISKSTTKDSKKPEFRCAMLSLKTGKYTFFEKFFGCCNEYVFGAIGDTYYKYVDGVLEEIDKISLPVSIYPDISCLGYKLQSEDFWYTSSSKRDLEVEVWEQSNGWTQSIPVTTYQYTSMPPELYPWNGNYTTYSKPNPSWLPKMKKCTSFKVKINNAKNGEFECEFDVQGADLLGRVWLVEWNESKEIAFLGKPKELAVKAGHKTTLSFPSVDNKLDFPLALVVESNGFLDVQGTYEDEEAKSQLPLFAGMQAGPSGNKVVNAFFWEAPKGDAP